tara:strand:- start:120 stop:422 length:303 start_codon:yes stop_codon:yes gene_type:complete
MFIAMNRFKIVKGREEEFEKIWMTRDSYLEEVKGFKNFHLLKSSETEDYTLYVSHSTWDKHASFLNWTKSENFRKAHKNSGVSKGLYLGHPNFEGYEVII